MVVEGEGTAAHIRGIVGARQLSALMVRRDGPGLIFLAGHLGLMAATGLLVWAARGTWWIIPAVFAHGIVIVHLFAPFHEAIHHTAFRSRWLNSALAWFAGLALMLPPLVFHYQHTDHHTYTQDIARDPQMIPMSERLGSYLLYATGIPYFAAILKALFTHPFGILSEAEQRAAPASAHAAIRREAWIFWGVYLGLAVASVWLGTWAVAVYWLIPRVVAEPVMRVIRMSEHAGCARSPNMLENSRTTLASTPVRWLAWNMPLHAAHHAAPLVPFHAIPALNRILLPHFGEVRQGYVDAVGFQVRNALAAVA